MDNWNWNVSRVFLSTTVKLIVFLPWPGCSCGIGPLGKLPILCVLPAVLKFGMLLLVVLAGGPIGVGPSAIWAPWGSKYIQTHKYHNWKFEPLQILVALPKRILKEGGSWIQICLLLGQQFQSYPSPKNWCGKIYMCSKWGCWRIEVTCWQNYNRI